MGNFFSRNITLKVLSIFFAIVLWFIAIRDHNPEITRRFDNIIITVENEEALRPNGLALAQRIETEIDIQVRGRAHDFVGFETEVLSGFVDLSRVIRSGDQYLPVEIRGLPIVMTLHRLPQVWASIDELGSKEIPITLDMEVSEADGFTMLPYTLSPEGNVRILGPSKMLERITTASISLNVSETSQTIERSLPVRLYDGNGQLVEQEFVSADPGFIIVTIPIHPIRIFGVTIPLSGNPAYGYEVKDVEVFPEEITVSGEREVLNALQELTTNVLDIQDASSDVRRTLRLIDFEGISILPGQTASVEAVVRIGEIIEEKVLAISDIEIRNLPENRSVQTAGDIFEVTLRGAKLDLENISYEQIKLYLDLSNAVVGERYIELQIEGLPDGVELVGIGPQSVFVTVN